MLQEYERLTEWSRQYPSLAKFDRLIKRGRIAEETFEGYMRALKQLCELLGYGDPEKTLEKIRQTEEKEEYLDNLITELRQQGLTDTRITSIFGAVKWWLSLNQVNIDWSNIILPSIESQVEDRAPTKEELKKILNVCNLRDKAIVEVASSSGLRLNTLCTLKVGEVNFDYPDVARIVVKKTYTINGKVYKTGRKIGKKRTFFVTFITPEAKKILLEYLESRKKKGETITLETPLFTPIFKNRRGEHLDKRGFDVHWVDLLRRAFLNQKSGCFHVLHFHTLKKYAETQFINAACNPSYREFWLCHKGSYLESSYFRGEESKHLEEYRKAIPHLSILEAPLMISKEDIRKELLSKLPDDLFEPIAQKYGMTPVQLRNILAKAKTAKPEETEEEENDCQKLIDPSEIEQHLKNGWHYVAQVNGKIVIEK
jgi:integrase